MSKDYMKKYLYIILITIIFGCTSINQIHLESDGAMYSKGKYITYEDLRKDRLSSEIILTVDHDVPYEKVVELSKTLERNGVKKVGLKVNTDKLVNSKNEIN